MKQDTSSQQVTKKDLINLEIRMDKKFTTKKDLSEMEKRLGKTFVTKDDLQVFKKATKKDLDGRFEKFTVAFRTEMQFNLETFALKMQEQFTMLSDRLFNAIDPLTKELEIIRQERGVGANQIHEIREEITVIKKRITKLEQTSLTS